MNAQVIRALATDGSELFNVRVPARMPDGSESYVTIACVDQPSAAELAAQLNCNACWIEAG